MCSNGERGLLGIAVDPQFTTNHYVYLYYTFNKNAAGCPTNSTTTPVERISRFTLDVPTANVINPATEVVLLDGVLNFAGNHNGGQLRVGPDGFLYAGIGDGGCDYAGDSGCQGSNDASRDRNILNGKILRIGRDGSVPPTNPFLGAGTARCNTGPSAPGTICQETFAWGFRNPFRFAFRPGDGALIVNDVGHGRVGGGRPRAGRRRLRLPVPRGRAHGAHDGPVQPGAAEHDRPGVRVPAREHPGHDDDGLRVDHRRRVGAGRSVAGLVRRGVPLRGLQLRGDPEGRVAPGRDGRRTSPRASADVVELLFGPSATGHVALLHDVRRRADRCAASTTP